MKLGLGRLRFALIAVLLAVAQPAEARSFMAFLRAVGNSIAHPQHQAKPKPASHPGRQSTGSGATTNPSPPPAQQPATASASNDVPQPVAATPAPTVVPEPTIRAASAPAGPGKTRRDLPYAVPVPNKTGFVTSPYAPKAGLVDVRGFPSGTEVKDPYTGKVFLAP